MKKALYWGFVPCLCNPDTAEIETTNWFYGLLVDVLVWADANFNGNFMIVIKED